MALSSTEASSSDIYLLLALLLKVSPLEEEDLSPSASDETTLDEEEDSGLTGRFREVFASQR